jgi:hypothetical protein
VLTDKDRNLLSYREEAMKTIYVDYNALNTLALTPTAEDEQYQAWQSMQDLWKDFRAGGVRLVTSKQDLEKDIILRLNGQGCCITDVLRAMEAIEEFERWEIADKERAKQWKRILFFREQVEALPQAFDSSPAARAERDSVVAFLADQILSGLDRLDCPEGDQESTRRVLRDCLKDLHLWYPDAQWEDLKRTDYELNWEILCSILHRQNMEPVFDGDAGAGSRCLFGLLNRVVGLSKKSCRKLPVQSSHVDFIVKTALQRYTFCGRERSALHIYRCLSHGVTLFLTTDHELIERYAGKKDLLAGYSGFPLTSLSMVNPIGIQA